MEFGLEFTLIVGTDHLDTERDFFDDIIDEIDGISLLVTSINAPQLSFSNYYNMSAKAVDYMSLVS